MPDAKGVDAEFFHDHLALTVHAAGTRILAQAGEPGVVTADSSVPGAIVGYTLHFVGIEAGIAKTTGLFGGVINTVTAVFTAIPRGVHRLRSIRTNEANVIFPVAIHITLNGVESAKL
jgi:hypothetical protein